MSSKNNKSKYFLVHTVVDPRPDKILGILKDKYLYSSSKTKQSGLYYGELLDYVYLSLLGDEPPFQGGVNFIFDVDLLFEHKFRYALKWVGNDIGKTVLIDPKIDDVDKILDEINKHIVSVNSSSPNSIAMKTTSHELLVKNKINLNKYLLAICCYDDLTNGTIDYIKNNYPKVKILDKFPNSSTELVGIIYYRKYKKYRKKYLNLRSVLV